MNEVHSEPKAAIPTVKPKSGRGWKLFFLFLSIMTLTGIGVQIWYNSRQQLTELQLDSARKLWQEKGPRDYDRSYTIHRIDTRDDYAVQVRGGKVVSVKRNDFPLEERLFNYHSMHALFGFMEDFLQQDLADSQKLRGRAYSIANFDKTDGHLQRYIRSVMGKHERVEIDINSLKPMPP